MQYVESIHDPVCHLIQNKIKMRGGFEKRYRIQLPFVFHYPRTVVAKIYFSNLESKSGCPINSIELFIAIIYNIRDTWDSRNARNTSRTPGKKRTSGKPGTPRTLGTTAPGTPGTPGTFVGTGIPRTLGLPRPEHLGHKGNLGHIGH